MTSEQVLPVPTEAPTLTQSGTLAQSFDRAPEPTPASLHEQMERCLSFAAERYTATSYSPVSIVAHVTVRNSCDISFAGSETWVEVSAIPAHSGTAGRETGRFQSPIPPRGSAETLVQINDLRPDEETYRLEAKLWWASGGGRRPE
ncbi:MAG: hypothetical protein ACRD3M_14145 [Thermoanaerobaculia bacterium]